MIKRFKKGTYKLSAIAMIFFIALGCFTLTNAKADINTVSEPAGTMKTEQFSFEEPEKAFTTLDRAMDFIDFKFKVPDNIPEDYKFKEIYYFGEENLVSVDFTKINVDTQNGVSILVSNNDMIKLLKKMHPENVYVGGETIKPDIKFTKEPMNILDIEGTCLTVSKGWNIKKEDMTEHEKHYAEHMKSRPMMKIVEKYFIWRDDEIWYSIPYFHESIEFGDVSRNEISKYDIKIFLSSFKYPKDIQNIEYVSADANRFLEIYDNKDLITAREILGFAPKFPLNLPGGFAPTRSRIDSHDEILHDNRLIEMIKMETCFQLKDKDSVQGLHLYQTRNTSKYDDIVQSDYVIGYSYGEDGEDKKVKVKPIMINGIKVLTSEYEKEIVHPNFKGITKKQYYTWKQNDVVYEASFTGDIGNQEKIVKALINTP